MNVFSLPNVKFQYKDEIHRYLSVFLNDNLIWLVDFKGLLINLERDIIVLIFRLFELNMDYPNS
jgi:hypothetical protein